MKTIINLLFRLAYRKELRELEEMTASSNFAGYTRGVSAALFTLRLQEMD